MEKADFWKKALKRWYYSDISILLLWSMHTLQGFWLIKFSGILLTVAFLSNQIVSSPVIWNVYGTSTINVLFILRISSLLLLTISQHNVGYWNNERWDSTLSPSGIYPSSKQSSIVFFYRCIMWQSSGRIWITWSIVLFKFSFCFNQSILSVIKTQ